MMRLMVFAGLLCLSLQVAAAGKKLGTIQCSTGDDGGKDKRYVDAVVYGLRTDDGVKADWAKITFSSDKVDLKKWKKVLAADGGGMAIAFEDKDMRLEAWFEDMGKMSSFTYGGQKYEMTCDVDLE